MSSRMISLTHKYTHTHTYTKLSQYNAGFTSALAALRHLTLTNQLPKAPKMASDIGTAEKQ